MNVRKLSSLFTVFLLSLVIAISCTPNQQNSTQSNSTNSVNTAPIQVGFSAWPGWFPWQVSQEQKLFEANKVNVDLKWFDGYLDSINALRAGQLNANTQTLNDTISSVAAGSDQVIVLVNDNSTGNDKIIVREGINSIADLKGKKVAAEEGTVDHFLLLLGLKKAGLTQADIQFQPLETGAAAAAFVAGQVDAVGVFAPFTTKALLRSGSKELFSSKDFPGAIPDHLVVNRRLINERPQDVQALVNTWFATLDFIKANPDKAYEIMAKRAGVSVSEYKAYDAGTKIFSLEDNLQAFSPGKDMKSLSYAAGEISKFLVEAGLTKQAPNLNQILDDRFVKAYAAKQKS
ncbi:aliphatic sulfonate ABC transporter substrate-binding protein [Komarekiella sp. 'clone 1']|uniref:Aliphatic sulfonate ABC transporter substrate-binding protein n=1 Tax=Komarekiella delphini-convector SJRDD-AB1 TaxID=2593771 RepID=A0AA40T2P5_9NOST|nr:ABC transporter substrate-binding protein [Komarekiella delphini-convector]MBD6619823.1 aliphatic sulfonate ABC transporter substrate-binding protein [Komarekiella delphini-convector SJRDD-AB1]